MGPIIEEQAAMERHQPGGVSDSQGSVAHGIRFVVGEGPQRQSSDIREQHQEELVPMQYSEEEDFTNQFEELEKKYNG